MIWSPGTCPVRQAKTLCEAATHCAPTSHMLSTICVALMTKSPASSQQLAQSANQDSCTAVPYIRAGTCEALALRMSNFCAKGTLSSSSSTPRSPRATIRAWDLAMMPSMLVRALKRPQNQVSILLHSLQNSEYDMVAWGFSIFGQILGRLSLGLRA